MNVSLKPSFVLDELEFPPGKFVQKRIEMIDRAVLSQELECLEKGFAPLFVARGTRVKDAAGCEHAVDILIEDLDFISLQKLSKSGAYYEIECAVRIFLGQKCIGLD